jgi:hypothetical protein
MNWSCIDPGTSIRKWTVTCQDWYEGYIESFWFKSNALCYASTKTELFVSIENEWTGEIIHIRQNPNHEAPPVVVTSV